MFKSRKLLKRLRSARETQDWQELGFVVQRGENGSMEDVTSVASAKIRVLGNPVKRQPLDKFS